MAESASLQELLTCSVCLDRYTFPKTLPCMHTFCLNCLRGIAKDAVAVSCPQCREEHRIPENDIQNFKDNLIVKNLLGMFGDVAKCSDCKRESNLAECGHCHESVCGGCRMNHEELVQELQETLRFLNCDADVPDEDEKTTEKMKRLLEKIDAEQGRLPRLFDHLREQINRAQDEASSYYDVLKTRTRAKLRDQKPPLQQRVNELISGCKSINALKLLKTVLDCTEMTMNKVLQLDSADKLALAYEYNAADGFGRVNCCDETVELGRMVAGETLPERKSDKPAGNVLPCKVDYRAKKPSSGICMNVNPSTKEAIRPLSAVYSPTWNCVFCIIEGETNGEGQVLSYAMDGSSDTILSASIQNAHDLACTKSGKLLIALRNAVTIIDLVASEKSGIEKPLHHLELRYMPSSSRICSHGEEFVILDREKRYLKFYSEDGKLLRSMRVTANEDSMMTVGKDGRIYIAFQDVTKRKDYTGGCYIRGCDHSRKSYGVHLTLTIHFSVVPWEGGNQESFDLPPVRENYNYEYIDCPQCGQTKGFRVDVSNRDLRRIYALRGFCVDGDGYIGLTSAYSKNFILIYSPIREYDTSIKALETEQEDGGQLHGVSLTPDGRLIYCDYGNRRILMI